MNVEVVALGIKDVTDGSLEKLVSSLTYFKLGQIDKPIKALKEAGITRAVMAGKVQHASLFGGVIPDLRAAKLLARLSDKRTDTILKAVAAEFAKDGIELLSSATYLSHLLVSDGPLTARQPDAVESADLRLGWRAAKAVAGFDIGQTVVVGAGAVIAVEGMEGTDACLLRAGEIASSRGQRPKLVAVKVAKPKQDLRFDLPVIGLDTLGVCARAGVSTLALESQATLIFDRERFLAEADAQRLAVVGLPPAGPP